MPKQSSSEPYVLRRRWTVADARAAVAALSASGLSVAAFARRENLQVQRLRRWCERLGREDRRRPEPGEAAPRVPEVVEIRTRPAAGVEIVLRSGRLLKVAETIDVAALTRLVAALERA
jgi:transposase-like protein